MSWQHGGMKRIGSLVALGGAGVLAAAIFLPWVEVRGLPISLDTLGVDTAVVDTTVSGDDTGAWPVVALAAGSVALFAIRRIAAPGGRFARWGILIVGLLAVLAAAGLLYYVANLVDIELSDRTAAERAAAELALDATAETGAYALLIGGLAITFGGALSSR